MFSHAAALRLAERIARRTGERQRVELIPASCAERITPGDPVQYGIDNQLEHHSCPDELTIGPQGVCGGCYLEMPLSGTCGVC
jgi:hypothetical protein